MVLIPTKVVCLYSPPYRIGEMRVKFESVFFQAALLMCQCLLCYRVLDMEEMTGGDYIKHLLLGCLDNLLNKLSQSDDEQQGG